jgi:hypothetical protein
MAMNEGLSYASMDAGRVGSHPAGSLAANPR